MWPKRKIQLVTSSAAQGIEGVRAMLKEIGLEFLEGKPSTEELTKGFTDSWWEKPLECNSTSASAVEESGPITEWVFWPEVPEHNLWRERALAQGLTQQSIQSLIHNILKDEVILGIPEHTVIIEGRPLLGHVLNEAGFESSILWPTADEWLCERKQGLHWILPEAWLTGLMGEGSPLGRDTEWTTEKVTWVVCETRVDFYRAQETSKFVGHLPRWPEPLEEQEAYRIIAKCLELGVSWLDIRLALSSIWNDTIMTDNLRWSINDFGWNAGACGEKLSAAPIEYMADWWASRDCVLAQNHERLGDRMAACAES
ncbi:MAG TPA: hypothetical protein VN456_13715 [Desulfosporosinus sp.]|nr:hypothetical protein [Desulfosporosinus sp.]